MSNTPAPGSPLAGLLSGLDPEQVIAVSAPPRPLVVTAGAGSGKTTVLTRRIAYQVLRGDASPRNVLAVTHTTKAAAEIRDRLLRLDPAFSPVSCMTVHAAAWKVLRQFYREAGFETVPELVSSTLSLVKDAARASGLPRPELAELLDLAAEFEWAASSSVPASSYQAAASAARRNPPFSLAKVAAALDSYTSLKRDRNVVDFGDLLSRTTDLLLGNASVAARVRALWTLIVVDEFQDTDRAQARFLAAVRGSSQLWTVVGDPRQTIYSFKGADPALLRAEMKAPGATVVHLVNSWRCSREILNWANALIGTSYGPKLQSASSGPDPVFLDVRNDAEEADALVRQLRAWRSAGVGFSGMAVLFRFNATAARVEAALTEADIPYQVFGGQRFLERPEVVEVLQRFGAAARLDPEENGLDLLRSCALEVGFDLETPPDSQGVVRARWESVRALVDMVADFTDLSAGSVLSELLDLATTDVAPGVTLATIHAAKGLEWDAVFVLGAAEGSIPSTHATSTADIAEERRLFYVALTRARTHLATCYARTYKRMPQRPSRFLFDLPGVSVRSSKAPSPARRGAATSSRSTSGSPRASFSTPQTRSGSSTPSSSATSSGSGSLRDASVAPLDSIGACEACGDRLIGFPARLAKRCSPLCLDGELRGRWERLASWRAGLPVSNGGSSQSISDKALFRLAVTGRTGAGWPKDLVPPE